MVTKGLTILDSRVQVRGTGRVLGGQVQIQGGGRKRGGGGA